MRKALCSIVFSLIIVSGAFGQTDVLILTPAQNEKWLDSLMSLKFSYKVRAIQNRIICDTSVYVQNFYNDRIRSRDSIGSRSVGYPKPLVLVNGIYVNLGNEVAPSQILAFSHFVTTAYVESVVLVRGSEAEALFGNHGKGGVFYLKMKKKRTLKKLKEFLVRSNSK